MARVSAIPQIPVGNVDLKTYAFGAPESTPMTIGQMVQTVLSASARKLCVLGDFQRRVVMFKDVHDLADGALFNHNDGGLKSGYPCGWSAVNAPLPLYSRFRLRSIEDNDAGRVDSYKFSHWSGDPATEEVQDVILGIDTEVGFTNPVPGIITPARIRHSVASIINALEDEYRGHTNQATIPPSQFFITQRDVSYQWLNDAETVTLALAKGQIHLFGGVLQSRFPFQAAIGDPNMAGHYDALLFDLGMATIDDGSVYVDPTAIAFEY